MKSYATRDWTQRVLDQGRRWESEFQQQHKERVGRLALVLGAQHAPARVTADDRKRHLARVLGL